MTDIHADALEHFNRATHPDALREMQIAPAEDIQADMPLVGATVPFWVYPVVAFIAFSAVCIWAAS